MSTQVTCRACGATYIDDADWSGPAHSERDCIRELQALCRKARALLEERWGDDGHDALRPIVERLERVEAKP